MKKIFWHALIIPIFAFTCAQVFAQSYPVKPIRLIVPYPPGGATDIFGRILGARLGELLGQQIVPEQRAGAAGVLGAEAAARAAPDGYTLVVGQASNLAINQHLMSKLPYDPVKDFAPITLIATSPNLLVVHPSLPARSVNDLVALAKARPGSINYASAGNGSPGHLAAEYFKKLAKVDIVHIPYKGATPALTDVIAGQASLYFTSPIAAQPYVQSGRLRQLAVTSAQRFPPLPDVPTVMEAGIPDFRVLGWYGIAAPAKLDPAIRDKLNADLGKVLATESVKASMAKIGITPIGGTADDFGRFLIAEYDKFGDIIKKANISIE